ncbi:MAG: ribonuclease P protein component 1 [Halobaculum sp.]
MLTATTVLRHELNGLPARVAAASDPGLVGIAGRVVSETTRTLVIRHDPTRFPGAVPRGPAGRSAPAAGESSPSDGSAVTAEGSVSDVSGGAVVDEEREASDDETSGAGGVTTDGASDAGRADGPSGTAGDASDAEQNSAETDSGRRDGRRQGDKRVPKREATFEFAVPTDEAASTRVLGSTFELPWETAGTGTPRPAGQSGGCEDVGYVTVDGARLVARPARRTERAGDTLWQSD